MSDQKYKIHRWDSVLFGNSTDPTPIIYVKPDAELLQFAHDNKNALLIELNSTNSIYDKKRVTGLWYKSSEIPNGCRPNFFDKTGLYVIVLQAPWHGYPDCLGDCSIFGLTGGIPVETIKEYTKQRNLVDLTTLEKGKTIGSRSLPVSAIVGILLGFLVLFALIYYVYMK